MTYSLNVFPCIRYREGSHGVVLQGVQAFSEVVVSVPPFFFYLI